MNRLFLLMLPVFLAACLAGHAEPSKPTIALIAGEYEYQSTNTLPAFKQYLESAYPVRCLYFQRTGGQEIPGLESLTQADLVVVFVRRMTLPSEQLAHIQNHLKKGKPLIGIRTASHAFENWKEFDRDVLGGNYHGHHGKQDLPTVRVIAGQDQHPILKNVSPEFTSAGSLYKTSPLREGTTALLTGTISNQPAEPVAWTHTYQRARVFYTSLGHPKDFDHPAFRQLLVNAIFWALDQPIPAAARVIPDNLKPGQPADLNVTEFEKLWKTGRYIVLDVRTPKEFAAGHLPGAVNLDFLADDFKSKVAKLDTNKVYLVYCASGRRSVNACKEMKRLQFPYLANMLGGFKSWDSAQKPVEHPAK